MSDYSGKDICAELRNQAKWTEEKSAYPGADPDLLRAAAHEIERLRAAAKT